MTEENDFYENCDVPMVFFAVAPDDFIETGWRSTVASDSWIEDEPETVVASVFVPGDRWSF